MIRLNSSIDRKQSAVQTSSYVTLLVAVVSELLGVDFNLVVTCLSPSWSSLGVALCLCYCAELEVTGEAVFFPHTPSQCVML